MTRANKVLALVCAGTFLTALDVTIVNVAYRSIREALGGPPQLPWIISGYNIAFAAGLLTAGRMADSFGRKRAFLGGITLFCLSSALCGLSVNVGMLIASRLCQAMGGALIVPSAIALVLPEFPVERRSAVMGITSAVGGLGASIGPVLGGLVLGIASWKWVFFINVPICVLAVVVGRRLLHESRDPTSAGKRPDLLGALLALGSVALVTLALVESHAWGWTSRRLLGCFAVALMLGSAFVRRSRHHPVPTLDLGLMKMRFVVAANVAGLLYGAGFYSFNFLLIQWLREIWQFSPAKAGLAAVFTPLLSMSTAPWGGKLAQRFGHNRVAVPGLMLFGLSALLIAWRITVSPINYWTGFFPYICLLGVSIGMTIGVLSSAAAAFLPRHRLAMGSALYATGRQVGGALGVAIVAAIVASTHSLADGYRWSWRYVTVVMMGAALAMAVLFRRPTPTELAAADQQEPVALIVDGIADRRSPGL